MGADYNDCSTQGYWKGPEGDDYHTRDTNKVSYQNIMFRRYFLYSVLQSIDHKILGTTEPPISSIAEFGSGSGLNLYALGELLRDTDVQLYYHEINENITRSYPPNFISMGNDPFAGHSHGMFDITLSCGFLIHIHPQELHVYLNALYQCSSKYIIIAEYFRPEYKMIPYRGMPDLMWAGDFGKIMKELYPDLMCIATHFAWKETTGMDNLTVWVFQK